MGLAFSFVAYNHIPVFKAAVDGILTAKENHQTDENDTTANDNNISKKGKTTATHRNHTPKQLQPNQYTELDNYARNTPETQAKSISTLANYLNKAAHNDVQKTRLAFTWIATHVKYDAEGFNTDNITNEGCEATTVLKKRVAVCEGYSNLFAELGTAMGLEVVKITGYAKGWAYDASEGFDKSNHAWNAVKVDGKWKLLDATWGSGYAVEAKPGDNKHIKAVTKFDPYWFDVDPQEFIFSHLPEENKWQLLGNPISMKQYAGMPWLMDDFFKMGFNSNQVFNDALSGKTKDFAETYPIEFPTKFVSMPYAKYLQVGQAYYMSIQSDYAEDIKLIDGDAWNDFKKEGNLFTLSHTPQNDTLLVVVKVNWFDKDYQTIARYITKGKSKT